MTPKTDPANTSRLAHFIEDKYNTPGLHHTWDSVEKETRPKNAYVNFIIKF